MKHAFHQRLNMYCSAAGAAGVAALALVQPAAGEIVYTPTNVLISVGGLNSYALDLNADGTTDFLINEVARQSIDQSGGTSLVFARPAMMGNGIVGYGGRASALQAGDSIGSGKAFNGGKMASLFTFMTSEFQIRGKWGDVKNRYLGFKFQINGETHYGWARLNVGGKPLVANLTGYAYETVPNMPIVAGKTKGPKEALSPAQPNSAAAQATLGKLALGAAAPARH
jgi:hypothetical protein